MWLEGNQIYNSMGKQIFKENIIKSLNFKISNRSLTPISTFLDSHDNKLEII